MPELKTLTISWGTIALCAFLIYMAWGMTCDVVAPVGPAPPMLGDDWRVIVDK